MRTFLRLLVLLGLVLGAASLAPLASADASGTTIASSPDGSSGDSSGDSSSGSTGGSGYTGSTTVGTTAADDLTGSSGAVTPGDPVTSAPQVSHFTVTSGAAVADPGATDPGTTGVLPTVAPTTTFTVAPAAVTPSGTAKFAFHADQPGATFACTLTKNAGTARPVDCPATVTTTPGTTTAAALTISGLTVGSYVFSVAATGSTGLVETPPVSRAWRIGATVVAPDNYSVPAGATFNDPVGTTTQRRRNLTHVIRTIRSMPGYHVSSPAVCDPSPAASPSTIRISLYSATDMDFARALVGASRRCVSVQILMNNHLSAADTPAIAYMQNNMGRSVYAGTKVRRSWAHRCGFGCRGQGVLHAKFYLFDSALTTPRGSHIGDTVMVGSSNMTSNAARVQWNDLYTVRADPTLHAQYNSVFRRMQTDRLNLRTLQFSTGSYQTTFTPVTPGGVDPTMTALRSIHCVGATGGTGLNGRTVVYINMHAWFGVRGYAFAQQVRSMYDHGCYVHVLYSFMSLSVYKKLTFGTGPRMTARRTIFSRHGGINATLYSHFKNVAVSGYVGGNHAAYVSWTGSNNFTNDGLKFDEVTMRIASRAAFLQYRGQFAFITRTRSAATYASFAEPIGGGRAVR